MINFFTPFESPLEFGAHLLSPISGTLYWAVASAVYAIIAAVSALVAIGLFLLSLITMPLALCVPEVPLYTFGLTFLASMSFVDSALSCIRSAVVAVAWPFLSTIALATRTTVTIVDGLTDCCSSEAALTI